MMPTTTTSAAPAVIEISHLYKTYKGQAAPAVNNLSLTVAQGEIFGLLGPNGAGKTTTVHILCGLCRPDGGAVRVGNFDLRKDLMAIKTLIGVVPQDTALYPSLTAAENLTIFGRIAGLKGQALNNRIAELLAFFGLEQHKHRRISQYSGGMKRRMNLMAGLLHAPRILFLDEPTVGVDVQSRTLILENLRKINRDGGCTLIYTSHYLEEAEALCSRVAFMDEGRLLCEGAPDELIRRAPESCTSLETLYLHLTGKKPRD
jgi:ABC-2 type transport system ATP-binding protein